MVITLQFIYLFMNIQQIFFMIKSTIKFSKELNYHIMHWFSTHKQNNSMQAFFSFTALIYKGTYQCDVFFISLLFFSAQVTLYTAIKYIFKKNTMLVNMHLVKLWLWKVPFICYCRARFQIFPLAPFSFSNKRAAQNKPQSH